jgi:hypothetical protein
MPFSPSFSAIPSESSVPSKASDSQFTTPAQEAVANSLAAKFLGMKHPSTCRYFPVFCTHPYRVENAPIVSACVQFVTQVVKNLFYAQQPRHCACQHSGNPKAARSFVSTLPSSQASNISGMLPLLLSPLFFFFCFGNDTDFILLRIYFLTVPATISPSLGALARMLAPDARA